MRMQRQDWLARFRTLDLTPRKRLEERVPKKLSTWKVTGPSGKALTVEAHTRSEARAAVKALLPHGMIGPGLVFQKVASS